MVWPARVVTPGMYYDKVRFLFEEDGIPAIYNRQGKLLARLEPPDGETSVRTADPGGERRWWFTAGGTAWLVEQSRGCASCGGSIMRPTTEAQLEALAAIPS